MKPILLLLFAATAACVGALLPLISRARSKRLLLNAVRRASSDAPDGIGISVLCSGVAAGVEQRQQGERPSRRKHRIEHQKRFGHNCRFKALAIFVRNR